MTDETNVQATAIAEDANVNGESDCLRASLTLSEQLELFDAPVLVVDRSTDVVALNSLAEKAIGKSSELVKGQRGGDVMSCKHARLPGGCGKTVHCKTCAVRRTVESTIQTGRSEYGVRAYVDTDRGRLSLTISTEMIDSLVYVSVQEAELIA